MCNIFSDGSSIFQETGVMPPKCYHINICVMICTLSVKMITVLCVLPRPESFLNGLHAIVTSPNI